MTIKSFKIPFLSFVAMLILGAVFNFGTTGYVQLIGLYILVNMILGLSLNLVNGITGQFSLGHAGFAAVGAYVAAYLSVSYPIFNNFAGLFVLSLAGGLTAAVFGWILGQPSLRLKGDYLAIVTLGFGEIIRVAFLNMEFLGGARGIAGIPGYGSFMESFSAAALWVVITFGVLWRLVFSSYGRAFLSVREDELAAEAMGINTTKTKVSAFVISSFFAGVAGSLMAYFTHFISPSSFTYLHSINAVIMVVLGGMGSLTGSILSAVLVTLLPEALRSVQELTGYDLRMVIYSLMLILMMILRPQGLLGRMEWTDFWHKYVSKKKEA